MKVKFAHSVIFVKDIEVSKKFYADVLGIKIIQDCGIFILFEGDLAIHQARELLNTVYKKDIAEGYDAQGRNNLEVYFESDKLDEIYARLKEYNVEFIHGIEKQSWGQNVFRFYDPDRHVVEIGEPSFKSFDV